MLQDRRISAALRAASRAVARVGGEKWGKVTKRGEKRDKRQKMLVNINFLLKMGVLCKMYRCRKNLPEFVQMLQHLGGAGGGSVK